jgi:hypothetical protein
MGQYISYLCIKKAYDLGDVFYSILTAFDVTMKLAGLIKMCLNETTAKSAWVNICLK